MSVDVEIYMNNILKFFRENPNDLLNLIPKEMEEEFYKKIREEASKNYDNGEDVTLTQQQIIDICVDLNGKTEKPFKIETMGLFMVTKFGRLSLN